MDKQGFPVLWVSESPVCRFRMKIRRERHNVRGGMASAPVERPLCKLIFYTYVNDLFQERQITDLRIINPERTAANVFKGFTEYHFLFSAAR